MPITLLVLAASCVRLSDSYTHLESYSPADTEVLKEFVVLKKIVKRNDSREMKIIVETKHESQNILTIPAFAEMIELNRVIYEDIGHIHDDETVKYPDLCVDDEFVAKYQNVDQRCVSFPKPFDFVYNPLTDSYDLA